MATQRRLVEAVEVTDSVIHIIRLKDIFDASTVNEFEKVISFLLAKEFYKIVVDLGRVTFISSAGWGAFTAALRSVRQNHGDIKLANLSHDVFDVFLLLELDSFIQAYESVEEAVTAFTPRTTTSVAVKEPSELAPPIIEQIHLARSRATTRSGAPAFAEAEQDFSTITASGNDTDSVEGQQEYAGYDADDVHDDRGVNDAEEFANENAGAEINYENEFAAEKECAANNGNGEVELDYSTITPNSEGEVEEAGNYLGESDVWGNDAAKLPTRAASGPEMWELLIANNKPVVDPYMFRRRPPLLPEGQTGQDAGKSGAESFGADQQQEDPPEAGREIDFSAHDPVVDDTKVAEQLASLDAFPQAGFAELEQNPDSADQEELSELISETELHFSGPEPIVEEQISDAANNFFAQTAAPDHDDAAATFQAQGFESESRFPEYSSTDHYSDDLEEFSEQIAETGDGSFEYAPIAYSNETEEFSGEISESEGGFGEYAPVAPTGEEAESALSDERNDSSTHGYVHAESTGDEQFDELETQDIRDPWILEEIDTIPEEHELYEKTPIEEEPRIAASKFWSDDSEAEAQSQDWTPNHESQDQETLVDILPSEALLSDGLQEEAEAPFTAEVESIAAPAGYNAAPINNEMMELIRDIVAAYPHYGPAMICKHLEVNFEPPISISRSTVYRYLREADLNRLEKRLAFAGRQTEPRAQLANVAFEA